MFDNDIHKLKSLMSKEVVESIQRLFIYSIGQSGKEIPVADSIDIVTIFGNLFEEEE